MEKYRALITVYWKVCLLGYIHVVRPNIYEVF
jgi:hypothetical protein